MHHTKVVRLLSQLDRKALQRMGDFVASPYFNKSEDVSRLFNHLAKAILKDSTQLLQRPMVALAVYGQADPGKYLDRHANLLVKLFEQFVVQQQVDADPLVHDILCAKGYRALGMADDFIRHAQAVIKDLKADKRPDDGANAWAIAILSRDLFFHPAIDKYKADGNLLHDAIVYLDSHYLAEKCRLVSEGLLRGQVYSPLKAPTDAQVLHTMPSDHGKPALQLHTRLIALMLSQAQYPDFSGLIDEFERHVAHLSGLDKRNIAAKIMYACQYHYEHKDDRYLADICRVIQLAHTHGFITDQGQVSPTLFVNLAIFMAEGGHLAWVDGFIHDFAPALNGHRDNSVRLAQGYRHFHAGLYTHALACAEAVDNPHPHHRIQAEALCLRACCELAIRQHTEVDYTDIFERCLWRLEHYLRGEKALSPRKSKAIKAFVRLCKDIFHYYENPQKAYRQRHKPKIQDRLNRTGDLFSAPWIHRKVQALP